MWLAWAQLQPVPHLSTRPSRPLPQCRPSLMQVHCSQVEHIQAVAGMLTGVPAGAVLVAKTNMDQFAAGLVGTRSPYGTAHNAFDRRSAF